MHWRRGLTSARRAAAPAAPARGFIVIQRYRLRARHTWLLGRRSRRCTGVQVEGGRGHYPRRAAWSRFGARHHALDGDEMP
ncbi:Hypothetical protein CAP_3404 [Chondromyces apiculatus DSM 436]|uniref:Uncharacterized protein n=1 Tax=Chondromyces apiculatus DSM 436 TaxID=1192034 RepID=A0A017T7P5_9BACT|nr:Hypothetical protein CAP_3404 [Chondromyces apiculatus DSM 436]